MYQAAAPTIISDGFIHFSTAAQVPETATRSTSSAAERGLFLIAVDAHPIRAGRYAAPGEPSRNEEMFPHLYGELDLGAVVDVLDMRARSDGFHDIPELEP